MGEESPNYLCFREYNQSTNIQNLSCQSVDRKLQFFSRLITKVSRKSRLKVTGDLTMI